MTKEELYYHANRYPSALILIFHLDKAYSFFQNSNFFSIQKVCLTHLSGLDQARLPMALTAPMCPSHIPLMLSPIPLCYHRETNTDLPTPSY